MEGGMAAGGIRVIHLDIDMSPPTPTPTPAHATDISDISDPNVIIELTDPSVVVSQSAPEPVIIDDDVEMDVADLDEVTATGAAPTDEKHTQAEKYHLMNMATLKKLAAERGISAEKMKKNELVAALLAM